MTRLHKTSSNLWSVGLQVHAAVYDVFSVVLHGVLIFLVCFVILSSGVQQRKFYLSIFALCGGSLILVKAEVILGIDGCTNDALSVILGDLFNSSIFALCGGSFIFVKAEVTLEIDGCTDEALSVILGGLSCVFTCQSNVGKADISKDGKADISKEVLEPLRFGFSLALCFSHLNKLWYNLFWEFFEFIFLKILLNQLQVIFQVVCCFIFIPILACYVVLLV